MLEINEPRGANLPLGWARRGQARQTLPAAGRTWQEGDVLPGPFQNESHLVLTQCGLRCDEPKITATVLQHVV